MEELGNRTIDLQFDFNTARNAYTREVDYYVKFVEFVKRTSRFRKYNHMQNLKVLNQDQKQCMQLLHEALKQTAKNDHILFDCRGIAGSGKGILISALCTQMDMKHIEYCTCAFTGSAAIQFNAFTVFGLLGIFNCHAKHEDMVHQPIWASTRDRLRGVKAIVLDESFLCSAKDFGLMINRLKIITGRKEKLPCSIYAFGDTGQLRPVTSYMLNTPVKATMDSLTRQGLEYFAAADYKYELTVSVRQQSDPQFSEILNRIRTRETTEEDIQKLSERLDINLSLEEREFFKHQIHLFSSNKQCFEFSKTYMLNSDYTVRRINPTFSIYCKECAKEYRELYVAENLKVFLTRNKIVSNSLVNGSEGIIKNIYYTKDNHLVPKFISVVFSKYIGLTLPDGSVPIAIQKDKVFCIHLKRYIEISYFPLQPFISRTVHRSQSATYEYVVINFDSFFNFDRKIYTSLSRCVKLQNLMLVSTKPLHYYFRKS